MDNSNFIEEVKYWEKYFSETVKPEDRLIELAFFKIFVKFELFVSEIFIHYCIGNESKLNYKPTRKLNFLDKNHFDGLIKNKNSVYIDYFSKMEELSPHIFEDEKCPFNIFSSASHFQVIDQMRCLRNYIAHESESSKIKYQKNLLNGKFLEPFEYLLKFKKGTRNTNYSFFIETLVEITEYLLIGPK